MSNQLKIIVQPRAKKDQILRRSDGSFKVMVKAPADKGKANLAVLQLLATELKVDLNRLEIVGGLTTRIKWVKII